MIARMRTIDEAFAYLKEKDPETALTRYYLRQLVLSGAVPSAKAGRKYLVNLDRLEEYLNHPPERVQEPIQREIGIIRPVPERLGRR